MKRVLVVTLFFLVFVSNFSPGYQAGTNNPAWIRTSLEEVMINPLMTSEMPVQINSASVKEIGGKSVLSYSVTNSSDKSLLGLRLFIFYSNATQKLSRAEGWAQRVDIEPHTTKDLTVELKKRVWLGSEAALIVNGAVTSEGTWVVSPSALTMALAGYVKDSNYIPPKARFDSGVRTLSDGSPAVECGQDFCVQNALAASTVCGAGKVQNFQCDQNNCTTSWTCRR
jgi:hypothetical protein